MGDAINAHARRAGLVKGPCGPIKGLAVASSGGTPDSDKHATATDKGTKRLPFSYTPPTLPTKNKA